MPEPIETPNPAESGKETPPATPPADQKPPTEPAKPKDTPATPPKTEDAPPAKVVPEKYDLKLPDGSILETSVVDRIAAIAKERGMSQEEAQSFLNEQNQSVATFVEERKKSWFEAVKGDKEFGGDAFTVNAELAKRVVQRFDPSGELQAELDKMGYGNHPAMFKFVTRIGKAMSEDQLVVPGAQTGTTKKSMEEIFYGEKSDKKE